MKKQAKSSLKKNEQGLAAVVVTIFVMLMLSLIVLAFSQISRREQRQALDRQLSTQAFYASEAGINNMVNKIRTTSMPLDSDADNSSCKSSVDSNNKIDADGVAAYTCVLYDRAPKELVYGTVGVDEGQVISLKTDGNNLVNLTLEWNGVGKGSDFKTCSQPAAMYDLPTPQDYKCNAGMLRVQLFQTENSVAMLSRETLVNNSYTVYLRPITSEALSVVNNTSWQKHSSGPTGQGNIIGAKCDNTTGKCSATISSLPKSSMFMHVRSMYQPNELTITGKDGTQDVRFNDAQIKIDSTGRAQDVLKRLQVRVPLRETMQSLGFAISALDGICKKLSVLPDTTKSDSDCNPPTAPTGTYFN